MAAKAIISAKPNSFGFEDRVILLEVPAKIGRSHKDEQAESTNGYFDCKVLSRQHAIIMYEEGRFYLLDTGSSNGTFVNNIRLSKSGEESKMTEIFTNDILRFGSDIVDKSRQVTQKCVIGKIRLYLPDGTDIGPRPPESRLFRPTDSFEDLHAITMSLQETLTREKQLEEKLLKVKGMISKNIGKSHTDLLRIFEDVKVELMNIYQERELLEYRSENDNYEKIAAENRSLSLKIREMEKQMDDKEQKLNILQKSSQSEGIELIALKKACQLQKQDLENMQQQVEEMKREVQIARETFENERRLILLENDSQLKKKEDQFVEERTKLKEQLHEVVTNEINLLNRIKSLEADEGYSRAEVDRILTKDRENYELNQQLQYRIDCLDRDLAIAKRTIEDQRNAVEVRRDPEDIETISKQETTIGNLQKEMGYLKQELIEARAHKSASDDKLGNVSGKLETLENTITSLSDEVSRLRKTITILEDENEILKTEANHMRTLVEQMESSPGQDERNKVQIADLKNELAKRDEALENRSEELLKMKKDLRLKDETIQQREIEISCLRGQIQNLEEELNVLRSDSSNIENIKSESLRKDQAIESLNVELDSLNEDNARLMDDLKRQQSLYNELKKMRGRGEEIDLLQQVEQQHRDAQIRIQHLEHDLNERSLTQESLAEEKIRLLREIAKLKAGKGSAYVTETIDGIPTTIILPNSPSEAALTSIGSLRLYEITLGIFFVLLIVNWTLVPN